METKIQSIQAKDYSLGKDGISFIFITDTHLPRNSMHSPYLIRRIMENTNVRFVINGGDTLDNENTKKAAIDQFYQWRNLMYGIREYNVIGNHDLNTISQTVEEAKLTRDEFYSVMFREHEENVVFDGNDHYILDYPSQKIRFIIVSTSFSATNSQGTWLKNKMTELSNDWSIIVVTHYFWRDQSTLHSGGEQLITAINEVYDSLNATFICIIAGHAHQDISMTESTKGYLIISTTSDARTSESGNPRTIGTINEHAFDIVYINKNTRTIDMIRIGSGIDRNFNY